MKRKTSTTPTRIYSYGCLPPTAGADFLEVQLRLAHRYRNTLVEIERRRRERVDEAQRSIADVGQIAARADELSAALAETRAEIKKRRLGHVGRRADIEKEAELAKSLLEELRGNWKALKEAKQRIKQDQAYQQRLREIEEAARTEIRAARATSGVYWGTYLQTEASIERAYRAPTPPKFARYRGEGRVAIQLQGGINVARVFGCTDWRLRIRPLPEDTFERRRHQRRLASRTVVSLRVGTAEDKSALWVELPLVLHRPLPADALVKWAWVFRRKVGLRFEYKLQLVLEAESFRAAPSTGNGAVAIDFGWRKKSDETIRVGYWLDSNGDNNEIIVPIRTQLGIRKPEELRCIRDNNFESARVSLLGWIGAQKDLPDWFKESTRQLERWRAAHHLVRLLHDWQDKRIAGDEQIVEQLTAWEKQDRHLFAWEANQRDRRLNHRREQYRRIAAQLARKYSVIVVNDFDIRRLAERLAAEDGIADVGLAKRKALRLAAPGELRSAIKVAGAKYGSTVVEIRSVSSSCHKCGAVDDTPQAVRAEFSCPHCGERCDEDYNACANLLAFAGLPGTGGAASQEPSEKVPAKPRKRGSIRVSARSKSGMLP